MSNGQDVSPHIRMGPSVDKSRRNRLIFGTWNIEGMTDIKIREICMYMQRNSIDVMCVQETRKRLSDSFTIEKDLHSMSKTSLSSEFLSEFGESRIAQNSLENVSTIVTDTVIDNVGMEEWTSKKSRKHGRTTTGQTLAKHGWKTSVFFFFSPK